jgi:hypothetical protein
MVSKTRDVMIELIPPPSDAPGDDPRYAWYGRVGDVMIDQNVQRSVNPAKITAMGEWSWPKTEAITLNLRANGDLVAVEGQHRLLKKQAEDPDARMWFMVLTGEKDEAGVALGIASSRKPHTAYEKWQLALVQGGEMQVAAQDVLDRLGLTLSNYTRAHGDMQFITAVSAVARVMRTAPTTADGADLLDRTCSVIVAAFVAQRDMWTSAMLRAVSQVIYRNEMHGPLLQRLTEVLAKQTAVRWNQEVATRRTGQPPAAAIAEAIIADFNRGLSTGRKIT